MANNFWDNLERAYQDQGIDYTRHGDSNITTRGADPNVLSRIMAEVNQATGGAGWGQGDPFQQQPTGGTPTYTGTEGYYSPPTSTPDGTIPSGTPDGQQTTPPPQPQQTGFQQPQFRQPDIGEYQSPYQDLIQDLFRQARETQFEYDPSQDTSLQQAQGQAQRSVMEEMNRRGLLTSTMTGDRASQATAQLIPQYEQMAYGRHQQEIQNVFNQLNAAMQIENQEYSRYIDQYNMEMDRINLERQQINDAWNRVSNMGYVDNESSLILGVPAGTLSVEAQAAQEQRNHQLDMFERELEANRQQADLNHQRRLEELDLQHERWFEQQDYNFDRWLEQQGIQQDQWFAQQDYTNQQWFQQQDYNFKQQLELMERENVMRRQAFQDQIEQEKEARGYTDQQLEHFNRYLTDMYLAYDNPIDRLDGLKRYRGDLRRRMGEDLYRQLLLQFEGEAYQYEEAMRGNIVQPSTFFDDTEDILDRVEDFIYDSHGFILSDVEPERVDRAYNLIENSDLPPNEKERIYRMIDLPSPERVNAEVNYYMNSGATMDVIMQNLEADRNAINDELLFNRIKSEIERLTFGGDGS
mgnify:CR=1 FL=1